MENLAILITLDFIVITILITLQHIFTQDVIRKTYKKLSGDVQQVKTAQRADKKRDKKVANVLKQGLNPQQPVISKDIEEL